MSAEFFVGMCAIAGCVSAMVGCVGAFFGHDAAHSQGGNS